MSVHSISFLPDAGVWMFMPGMGLIWLMMMVMVFVMVMAMVVMVASTGNSECC